MKGTARIVAIVVFFLWLIVMWKSSSIFEPKGGSTQTGESKEAELPATEGSDILSSSILSAEEMLKSPFAAVRYQPLIEKNIFVKPQPPPEVFTPEKLALISISQILLPFKYNGFIQKSDGTMIGQINWSGKTYFLKKGDKFKDYRVLEINSKILKIENKDGQLVMEYKKAVKGKEMVAKIHNSMDDKDIEVKKNDVIGEYKVLDIKAASVILYGQNKEWVINKGR